MKKTLMAAMVALCVVCVATIMGGCLDGEPTEVGRVDIVRVHDTPPEYQAIPSPTPSHEIGTYENPTPLGKILTSSTGALDIVIAVVRRGEDVNYMAQRENSFNDMPKNGNEYMLVGIVVGYKEMSHLDNDEKFSLSSYDFDAYANNVECDSPFLVLPDKFDTSVSTYMMPGSVLTVWAIFEVPKGEIVTIAYDRTFVSDTYYFDTGTGNFVYKTTKTNSVISTISPTPEPTPKINSFQGMEILSKYDDDRDGILNNAEKVEITDLFMRDMLTPPQREAYIAIWGDPQ